MPPLAFDDFISRIDRLYATGRHAPATRGRMRQVLAELAALGAATTADLSTDLLTRYVAARSHLSPNTVNGYLGAIRSACGYALEEGWLERQPSWKRVRLRPAPMQRNLPPQYDQVSRLISHLLDRRDTWEGHRLCALVWTVALTAVRLNEALRAEVRDLDLAARALRIDPARQPRGVLKTGASARTVPVPDALAEVLEAWLPMSGGHWLFPGVRRRGPWTGGSAASRPLGQLRRAARDAGIGRVTWHALRHAYGTTALERWGVPVWIVQRVMGHTDARTTARYLHLDDSPRIAESVRGISYRIAS